MSKTAAIEQAIKIHFSKLDKKSAAHAFPAHGILADTLSKLVPKKTKTNNFSVQVKPDISSQFVTAAVEMWLRGVHSILISTSITHTSPIWASVSGYYASHYCVRGIAHLLGVFQLFRAKFIVTVEIMGGKHMCHLEKKGANDGEHQFYWKAVKSHPLFKDEPFFNQNSLRDPQSEITHRSIANYSDHVNIFPNFQVLDEDLLKRRIEILSRISLSSVPLPRQEKFPDLDNVQLIAYHRLIIFRRFLDNILGGTSRFWKVHRNPNWCSKFLNFQVVEPSFISVYRGRS